MEYKKYNETYYIRMDKGDEIIGGILDFCKKEGITSGIFSGIGGCGGAELQTFIPETGEFETETFSGMLELISLMGDIMSGEDGTLYHHTHACFSYKDGEQHCVSAGHVKSIMVSYTAEIEFRPVIGGNISRQFDTETGTGFWKFE